MNIALIGASGFVGSAILNELIQRKHKVTAIVRHPEKVRRADLVTVVKANVLNENEVVNAVKAHDVVVSAYNAGWGNPNLYNEFLEGSKSIQTGVKKAGVKRLIVIGGAGSLYIADGLQLIDTPQFPEEIKPGASAARDYLNLLRDEKELDWTFFSPAIEMYQGSSGERKGIYRTGLENPVFDVNNRSVLSVEDLAVVIADEAESPKHICQRFTAAY